MRRELLLASLPLAFALAFAGGCTLLFSVDGLAGGDAGGLEGGFDGAAVGDATTSGDAGADAMARDAATDSATRFCPQPGTALCDDFDDVDASLPGPWDGADLAQGVTLTAVATRFRSAPQSLALQTTGSSFNASVRKDLLGMTGAELAFDLFIETRGSNLSVAWIAVGGVGELYVQPIDDTYAQLTERYSVSGMDVYGSSPGPSIPTGKWVRVSLDVDFPKRLAIFTVDGVETSRRTLTAAAWGSATSATVNLGVTDSKTTSLFYDDVTIKTR